MGGEGVAPSGPPLDDAADPGALDTSRQQHAPQQPQQQPFATDEAQARSFEDAIRSRPTLQLQPPSPSRPSRATYDGDLQHQSKQQQSRYMHPGPHQQQQPTGQYYSTWPPLSIPPSEARGMLSSAVAAGGSSGGGAPKCEFSSVVLGTPRSSGGGSFTNGYPSYISPSSGLEGGGRPKMARLKSGSVGRVPEGQGWEVFSKGYRGAAQGFGGAEGVMPSA